MATISLFGINLQRIIPTPLRLLGTNMKNLHIFTSIALAATLYGSCLASQTSSLYLRMMQTIQAGAASPTEPDIRYIIDYKVPGFKIGVQDGEPVLHVYSTKLKMRIKTYHLQMSKEVRSKFTKDSVHITWLNFGDAPNSNFTIMLEVAGTEFKIRGADLRHAEEAMSGSKSTNDSKQEAQSHAQSSAFSSTTAISSASTSSAQSSSSESKSQSQSQTAQTESKSDNAQGIHRIPGSDIYPQFKVTGDHFSLGVKTGSSSLFYFSKLLDEVIHEDKNFFEQNISNAEHVEIFNSEYYDMNRSGDRPVLCVFEIGESKPAHKRTLTVSMKLLSPLITEERRRHIVRTGEDD